MRNKQRKPYKIRVCAHCTGKVDIVFSMWQIS
jgi:hypothetical protein